MQNQNPGRKVWNGPGGGVVKVVVDEDQVSSPVEQMCLKKVNVRMKLNSVYIIQANVANWLLPLLIFTVFTMHIVSQFLKATSHSPLLETKMNCTLSEEDKFNRSGKENGISGRGIFARFSRTHSCLFNSNCEEVKTIRLEYLEEPFLFCQCECRVG